MDVNKKVLLASYLKQDVLYSKPKEAANIAGLLKVSAPPISVEPNSIKVEFGQVQPAIHTTVLSGGFILRQDYAVGTLPGTVLLLTDIDISGFIVLNNSENKDWHIREIDREGFVQLTKTKAKDAALEYEMFEGMCASSFAYFFSDFELGKNDVVETLKVHIALSPTNKDIFRNKKRHSIKCEGALLSFVLGHKGSKKAKTDFFNRISTAVEYLAAGLDELGAAFDVVVVHENSLKEVYKASSKDSENSKKDETE